MSASHGPSRSPASAAESARPRKVSSISGLIAGAGAEPEAGADQQVGQQGVRRLLDPERPSAPSSVYTSATLPGSSSTLSTLGAPRSLKNSIELGSVSVRSTPTMVGPAARRLRCPR